MRLAGKVPTHSRVRTSLPSFIRAIGWAKLRRRVRGHLALTFDDGPSPELTPDLLALLRRRGERATFFMTGANIDRRPDLAKKVVAEGHDVGSHGYDHLHGWRVPWGASFADMKAGMAATQSIGGRPEVFRPPYGKLTIPQVLTAPLHRTQFAWWTVDTRDSEAWLPKDKVLQTCRDQGGAVVLMHDFAGSQPEAHRDYVLTLTEALIDLAQAKGWRVSTLSQVGAKKRPARRQRFNVTEPS